MSLSRLTGHGPSLREGVAGTVDVHGLSPPALALTGRPGVFMRPLLALWLGRVLYSLTRPCWPGLLPSHFPGLRLPS